MSKMQMLLFATGIFVVAFLFLNFISGFETRTVTCNIIEERQILAESTLNSGSLFAWQATSIPDSIQSGIGTGQLYYDFTLSKAVEGTSNVLIMSITEHKKKDIICARKIVTKSNIVLIDGNFVSGGDAIDDRHTHLPSDTTAVGEGMNSILLYPRAKLGPLSAAAPNSFVIMKNVKDAEATLYIIPCSSQIGGQQNNCVNAILNYGCYVLKKENAAAISANTFPKNTKVPFNIVTDIQNARTDNEASTRDFTWCDCQNTFYGFLPGSC